MGFSETESDRRTQPRLRCSGTAKILILPDGPTLVGALENLSLGGCSFSCKSVIPAKLNARVEVQLDVRGFALRLLGEVRHIDKETRAGVEFVEVSSRKADQIRLLTMELMEKEKDRLTRLRKAREAAEKARAAAEKD
jgi:c-di-GMP-binding flagellar brake protein YcgR